MIDVLLCFMIVSLMITMLARSSISINKQQLLIQEKQISIEESEIEWWLKSNEGCRDTCLIDVLVYP